MSRRKSRTPWDQRPIVKARKVVEIIKLTLQKNEVITTAEVFVGGSVGHGTAITGHFDLDLVLYSRDIDHKDVAENGYADILGKVEKFLCKELAPNYTLVDDKPTMLIEFTYKDPDSKINLEVDLLLSPYFKDEIAFLKGLKEIDEDKRWRFSASASKYQTKFIKSQTQRVRELIRRAKGWKNVQWKGEGREGKPKSYLIGLLVIIAYDGAIKKDKSLEERKLKVVSKRVNTEMIKLVKKIEAADETLNLFVPGTQRDVRESELLAPCPRIIDPVNPANNVYESGIYKVPEGISKWEKFASKIDTIDLSITAEKMMAGM